MLRAKAAAAAAAAVQRQLYRSMEATASTASAPA